MCHSTLSLFSNIIFLASLNVFRGSVQLIEIFGVYVITYFMKLKMRLNCNRCFEARVTAYLMICKNGETTCLICTMKVQFHRKHDYVCVVIVKCPST